ncbi:ATP-binding protein [Nitrosospira briensis]|uniref:ATP-binding protein n=1 Tax=Nitrosospira briensis TaxID=35799 RepID=UPI002737888B|nr:ATP-binding protein [Nitrosospira briensis]
MLDRSLHHARVVPIPGESYRLKHQCRRNGETSGRSCCRMNRDGTAQGRAMMHTPSCLLR